MAKGNVIPDRKRGDEFLVAQSDPVWQTWLADMNTVVTDFVTSEIPEVSGDPFSADGLLAAERSALERFGSISEFEDPANEVIADKYIRYFGDTFVRNFGARWVNILQPTQGLVASVEYPYPTIYLAPRFLTTAALHRRTGTEWAEVFGYQVKNYNHWISEDPAGKMRTPSWAL